MNNEKQEMFTFIEQQILNNGGLWEVSVDELIPMLLRYDPLLNTWMEIQRDGIIKDHSDDPNTHLLALGERNEETLYSYLKIRIEANGGMWEVGGAEFIQLIRRYGGDTNAWNTLQEQGRVTDVADTLMVYKVVLGNA